MKWLSFDLLYLLCLAVCLGGIELAKATLSPTTPELPPPQAVEEVIAIPPPPEGAQPVLGEGEGDAYRYTEQACLAHEPGDYRNICFHQLARQRAYHDLTGALAACDQIPRPTSREDRDTRGECMSDAAELHAPTDRDAAMAVCPTIDRTKWGDQCVFGISLALSTKDSRWAFRNCDNAGKWREFCRHDVNGEIAVVNVDLALEHCAAEEGDLLRRKTCWHGIGKYIARVDVDAAFAACERVPAGPDNLYRENCIHGLGWGASETRGAAFAPECTRAGAEQPSCLLGIAYNLRRFDVQAGLDICAQVTREDLKAQCLKMVSEGSIHR